MTNPPRPYQLTVHPDIRERIAEPGLTALATEILASIDAMLAAPVSDSMLKLTRMSVAFDNQGAAVPIKLTVARGITADSIHVCLPRPLRKAKPCPNCRGVGWIDLRARELCPKCSGLATAVDPPPVSAPL